MMKNRIETIINQIIEIVTVYDGVEEILLYGSRAKGTFHGKSDIDIAIKGKDFDIDQLMEKIETIDTLLEIDLVDIENCKNELLKQEVKKDGITIYRKI